ncbi:MAG: nitrous oxide reductase accessory protein NosL [Candidatus Sedimenticola endophacoides]
MGEEKKFDRRSMMKVLAAAGLGGLSGALSAGPGIGVMVPGEGWVKASGDRCDGDGTPLQFIPKSAPDDNPAENDIQKYPKCPYCGMSRKKWSHSRHLVHYDDGLADGTCSIHCLAISLSLNIDRGIKAVYAGDMGSAAEIKPLVNADQASYLVGSQLKGTMAKKSKMAFSSAEAADAARQQQGGEVTNFDGALKEAYLSMHSDTMMIRKRRAERVKRMMEMKKG